MFATAANRNLGELAATATKLASREAAPCTHPSQEGEELGDRHTSAIT